MAYHPYHRKFNQGQWSLYGCITQVNSFQLSIPPYPGSTYEATLVYLIRCKGKLEIYDDRHILGLFKLETWLDLFKKGTIK
jgi:hypothetical protein